LGKQGMSGASHGTEQGWKTGQSIQSMGPVRVEVSILFKGPPHLGRGL
jgi:hypothetical protein